MVQHHHIEGYENFVSFIEVFKPEGDLVIYFSGTKEENTGESWCDDCQRAWPVISKVLKTANPMLNFVYVEVGDRPTWKDPNCPFRKNPSTKLMVLPTLIKWNTPKRLNGDQCEKEELVKMLFFEDDDDD
ncbi:thioredoxin domain-containing protein 17-like [Diorhabda carinulata]|uniref:thioredoxin domain-containing protein 17-like n=1 Tax=Diorhabda carinulata TaxID=1163345 RepID=UPI0025A25E1A|nr:thioredoxin domain-containing protein 17-like [Diorhabda carinulata]